MRFKFVEKKPNWIQEDKLSQVRLGQVRLG